MIPEKIQRKYGWKCPDGTHYWRKTDPAKGEPEGHWRCSRCLVYGDGMAGDIRVLLGEPPSPIAQP